MMGIHKISKSAAAPGVCAEARSGAKRALARARDEHGQSLVEFGLTMPLLFLLLLGTIKFGIVLHDYLELTNATNIGAQLLSISRGQTPDPCTTTSGAVFQAAPFLAQANLKFTIVLNGITAANGIASPSCPSAKSNLVASAPAQVTITYPCDLKFFGINLAPSCILTAQTVGAIQ
jgi:Flp pilus assembly protein TadG